MLLPAWLDRSRLWVRWVLQYYVLHCEEATSQCKPFCISEINNFLNATSIWGFLSLSPRVWGRTFWRELYPGLQLYEWREMWQSDRKMCVSAWLDRKALSVRWLYISTDASQHISSYLGFLFLIAIVHTNYLTCPTEMYRYIACQQFLSVLHLITFLSSSSKTKVKLYLLLRS